MDIDKYGLPVAVATGATISFESGVTSLCPMIGFYKNPRKTLLKVRFKVLG